MDNRELFLKSTRDDDESDESYMYLEGYGAINTKHLIYISTNTGDQAFDLKMRMTAYWQIVLKRMADWLVLQLRFLMQKVVNKDMEIAIVNEIMGMVVV